MTDAYTRPDFQNIALVTIDVQEDFLDDGGCPVPGTAEILPNIVTVLEAFRKARRPIVHVVRIYESDGGNVDLCRRSLVESGQPIVRPGTSGLELAGALRPDGSANLDHVRLLDNEFQALADGEWAMYKPRWGAFYRTPLEDHLRSNGVTTIAFAGCNFPNCPRTSIYEASERDFRVMLVTDAIAGLYDRGLEELRGIGVTLLASKELAAAVRSPAR